MRHIIIQNESIMLYPPTLTLIKNLKKRGDEVYVLSSERVKESEEFCEQCGVKIIFTKTKYSKKLSAIRKMLSIPQIHTDLKNELKKLYDDNSVIWIMTSITLKFASRLLSGKKYIMYMYELSSEIRYYDAFPFFKIKLEKLLKNASAVIECEYNRAHIIKAWFGLEKTPYIIPNKAMLENPICVHSQIQDEYARDLIKKLVDKKIILYQGIVDAERPIEPLIKAVNMLDDSYVLVIMSSDIKKLKKYENSKVYLIPFIMPPHHLEVTSWAYIGVLVYASVGGVKATSPLNSIYCAPNKLYEYSMFGIPMLGNNIPGLQTPIIGNKLGECYELNNSQDIYKCIKNIEKNYTLFSKNSKQFYDLVDTGEIINQILTDINC